MEEKSDEPYHGRNQENRITVRHGRMSSDDTDPRHVSGTLGWGQEDHPRLETTEEGNAKEVATMAKRQKKVETEFCYRTYKQALHELKRLGLLNKMSGRHYRIVSFPEKGKTKTK